MLEIKNAEVGTITIDKKEYRELVEKSARVDAFADYVNKEQYSIPREDCAIILGFDLRREESAN